MLPLCNSNRMKASAFVACYLYLLSSNTAAFSPTSINSKLKFPTSGSFSSPPSHTIASPSKTPYRHTYASHALFATKLSRPDRKRLEREKKEGKKKGSKKSQLAKKAKRYELHSNNVSELCVTTSSADDVIKAIKRAQNRHDVHDMRMIAKFLVDEVDVSFGFGFRGSLLARLAVGALHMSNDGAETCEIARRAINLRRLEYRSSMLPMESAAIIRGLLRIHNVTDAFDILADELSMPMDGTDLSSPESKDLLKHRAYSLSSIASRHFYEGEPNCAVRACQMLTELGPHLHVAGLTAEDLNMPWARIIQGAAQCESLRRDGSISCDSTIELPCNLVYSVLTAMNSFPAENDDVSYEALSNALVRRTLFITGAVSMEGCPEADRGEAVFIGRSNVGKSSLVNMVTNRKSLAFTSKRPGKTQQFNYFAVNDKPGKEKEVKYGDDVPGDKDPDSFYILDVPGFGFAKVPEKQRQAWSDFLSDYITTRQTLKVIFHLIDGRHGPIDEDNNIMKQIGESKPAGVKYVIVLTKADKNIKGPNSTNAGKVSKDVLEKVQKAAMKNGVGDAPIILTSAETKLGRDDVWRYLRTAAELSVEM